MQCSSMWLALLKTMGNHFQLRLLNTKGNILKACNHLIIQIFNLFLSKKNPKNKQTKNPLFTFYGLYKKISWVRLYLFKLTAYRLCLIWQIYSVSKTNRKFWMLKILAHKGLSFLILARVFLLNNQISILLKFAKCSFKEEGLMYITLSEACGSDSGIHKHPVTILVFQLSCNLDK